MKTNVIGFLLATHCLVGILFARDCPPDSCARITFLSLEENVNVFDDMHFLGTTPLVNISIEAGFHFFQYCPAGTNDWSVPALTESVLVSEGDILQRNIELPLLYHITSEPHGAAVTNNDSVLAYTPAFLWLPTTIKSIQLRKSDYANMEMLLNRANRNIHGILIERSGFNSVQSSTDLVTSGEHQNLPIYAVATIAVVSGVVAAFYKIEADKYYDKYRLTGNEQNNSKIHSFDRISGFSMAIEEISLIALAYLLLTR